MLLVAACDSAPRKLRFASGQSLGATTPCGNDGGVCPGVQRCGVLWLASGTVGPICVDPDICDRLTCDGNGPAVYTCAEDDDVLPPVPTVVDISCTPAT
ncbi:MAG TPA: hypothetical protein VHB97_08320 [Polyangia bacterium]|nr:hypothetical protein [Polyangia bacterium]